jgi:hypothetical protein
MVGKKSPVPPKIDTIEWDGDIPIRTRCSGCGAIFDAGSKHTMKENSEALQRQWEHHFKAKHSEFLRDC